MRQDGEAIDAEVTLDGREVKIEELLEDGKVSQCEVIDTAVACPVPFAGQGEAVLVRKQQECQVIMPQVAVEAVERRQIQQTLDLPVNARDQRILLAGVVAVIRENAGELHENAVLTEIGVQQQP